jgi:hypothetical protein
MKKQGVEHVINGAENALGFTILWRSVWTRHLQNHPICDKECSRGSIIELMAMVPLNGFDGAAKPCGDISETN